MSDTQQLLVSSKEGVATLFNRLQVLDPYASEGTKIQVPSGVVLTVPLTRPVNTRLAATLSLSNVFVRVSQVDGVGRLQAIHVLAADGRRRVAHLFPAKRYDCDFRLDYSDCAVTQGVVVLQK